MKNIKVELESIIFNVMLPESQAFLDELNEEIEKGNQEEEIIEAKKDIASFIEELNQVLKLIEEKKLSNKDAKDIYKKIRNMLDEHEDEHEH
ncbi:DNA repair protein Rad50 [Aliarcobacter butzleri]|uniref:DNA repair protein Rad50 n=1 Tax=Aliarcobacter butzleri TaxID=28197 RepID=UPI00102DD313|nr:DNA repair protein Rad50 [Aliarcobacter butzleri]RZV18538.1 DNA repair protein Rad50 [Aliarcobacter butzleri]